MQHVRQLEYEGSQADLNKLTLIGGAQPQKLIFEISPWRVRAFENYLMHRWR